MTGQGLMILLIGFGVTVLTTPVVMWLAQRWHVVDDPASAPERKRHTRPIPLLGGWAIIVATWLAWGAAYWLGVFPDDDITTKQLIGLGLAGLVIAIGGGLDDRRQWSARKQIWWAVAAAIMVSLAGIGVSFITNPFGGVIDLTGIQWTMFSWHGVPYHVTLWADLFTLAWLLGATYTTKLLDGLDGLVSGLGVIGALIVFLLTLRPEVAQTGVGILALSLTGAAAGFLVWNWHPARIFLGESGSLYIGFLLGTLAIISGGKIATALLILGLPILDVVWVVIQRLRAHTSPFTSSDRRHLHFRLLDAGLSVRQSVLIIYAVVALFGLSTLYVHGLHKVYTLAGLLLVMVVLVVWVMRRIRQRPTV